MSFLKKHKITLLFYLFFFLAFFFISSTFLKGGVIGLESEDFMFNFTDHRPLLNKVFDVRKNEPWKGIDFYQARELSYFFDIIDANFIKLSVNLGFVHFYSLTHYLGLIIISIISIILCKKYLQYKSITIPTILVFLFLTSPLSFFSGSFFRSSKILVAVFIALIIYLAIKYVAENIKRKNILIFISILSFFMSISDRQGFFFLLAFNFFSLLLYLLLKKKNYLNVFICFLIALLFGLFYCYVLGPFIIYSLLGYWPNFGYMHFQEYWKDGLNQIEIITYASSISLDTFSYFFGNLGKGFGLIMFIIFSYFFIKPVIHDKRINYFNWKTSFLIITFSIVSIIVLNALMITRHQPVIWEDVRRVYYQIPLTTLILFLADIALAKILISFPKIDRFLTMFLVAICFLNIMMLSYHLEILKNGSTTTARMIYLISPSTLSCLKEKNIPAKGFRLPQRQEKFCLYLRMR